MTQYLPTVDYLIDEVLEGADPADVLEQFKGSKYQSPAGKGGRRALARMASAQRVTKASRRAMGKKVAIGAGVVAGAAGARHLYKKWKAGRKKPRGRRL